MHATIRRYEGVDQNRAGEITKKVNEDLVPQLREQPGFSGYYLVKAPGGRMTSISLFDTATQAEESTRFASEWLSEEKLDAAVPNKPEVTTGEIIVHETSGVRV